MESRRLKVLYIAGSGRSGSTLLHNILGQIDGFCAVGEQRYVWERGLIKDRLCGCGVPFRECDVWRAVAREAFGGMDQVEAPEMLRLTESLRMHHLPLALLPHIRRRQASRLQGYLEHLARLYRAIQLTTGSRVIVDSSKNPAYGYVLRMIPVIELYVVHLVRDSRATAYSWSKKKLFQLDTTHPEYMAQKNSISSSLQWDARNIATEVYLKHKTKRYLMLSYQEMIADPQRCVTRVLNLLGETATSLPFVSRNVAELEASHSVFGNLVRFQTGRVELSEDNEWQSKMKLPDKVVVTALTWPLLLRYRHLLRAKQPKDDDPLASDTDG